MAFSPETLSLLVQPIGDVGLRIYSYRTDDTEATVTGAAYATNAAYYGLRVADLVIVTPVTLPGADPYIMSVGTIDVDGHATLASPGPIGDMLKSVYDPTNAAGDAFAMDNMAEGADTKILTAAERAAIAALGTASAADLLDEDDMASNSAVNVPSQQSVKVFATAKYVATRTALKALPTAVHSAAHLSEPGREGVFNFVSGDFSTHIAADPQEGIYVKADAIAATSGAWVRVFNNAVNVEWFGAVGDGTTDDGPAFNAAKDALWVSRQGGTIACNHNIYGVATDIVIDKHNIKLRGLGHSWASNRLSGSSAHFEQFGGTILKALTGAVRVLTFEPVADNQNTGTRLVGVGLNDIIVDAAGIALVGVRIASVAGGSFPWIVANEALDTGVHITVTAAGNLPVNGVAGATVTEPRDTQHLMIGKIFARNWVNDCDRGVLLDGDTIADTSLLTVQDITAWHRNGHGVEFGSSDGLTIGRVACYRVTGTGRGIMFRAGATTDHARKNTILWSQAGAGGVYVEGTASGAQPATDNVIVLHSFGNGTPSPAIEAGAVFSYGSDGGIMQIAREGAAVSHRLFRSGLAAGQIIGQYEFRGVDSVGTDTNYGYIAARAGSVTDGAEAGQIEMVALRSGVATILATFADDLSLPGGLVAAGTILGKRALTPDADGRTITTAETGTLFTNAGATAKAVFNLPAAAVGLRYGFMVTDTDGIDVVAATGDAIRINTSVSGANRMATSTTSGTVVWLVAVDASAWIAESSLGTWTLS